MELLRPGYAWNKLVSAITVQIVAWRGQACWVVGLWKISTSFEVYQLLYCSEEREGKAAVKHISSVWNKLAVSGQVCQLTSQRQRKEARTKGKGQGWECWNMRQLLPLKSTMRKRKMWMISEANTPAFASCSSLAYSTFKTGLWMPIMHCSRVTKFTSTTLDSDIQSDKKRHRSTTITFVCCRRL